jgi:hypothetical protein
MARWEVNWKCLDCGLDTNEHDDQYYMIHDFIWLNINPGFIGNLCLRCLSRRLGRPLVESDFIDAPVNSHITKELLSVYNIKK